MRRVAGLILFRALDPTLFLPRLRDPIRNWKKGQQDFVKVRALRVDNLAKSML